MSTTFANSAASDLDMEMDTSGFAPEDATPSEGGAACNKPGMYHVHVKDIKKEGNEDPDAGKLKTPCLRLDLEILAGSEPDQVGKTIYHRMYTKKAVRDGDGNTTGFEAIAEASQKMILRAAFGLGLIEGDQIGQGNTRIPWSVAPGCQCVVRVDAQEEDDFRNPGQKRTVHRINRGNIWRVDADEVKDVPKDPEALAMAGSGGGGAVDVSDL